MSSPQKENGYTAIANEIMEALIKYPLPGAQMQCLLLIIRKTYGFHKLTDSISLTQFVEWTGINRSAVVRALNNLVKRNMVYKEKGGIKSDTIMTSKYRFNKHHKSWNSSIKSETGSLKTVPKVVSKKRHTKDNKEIYTPNLKKFVDDFISYIKKESPNKLPRGKNLINNSLDTIDKLIRIDGFKEDYIMDAIRWSKKDDFWCNQIYSLSGLRNKNKDGLMKFQTLSIAFDKVKPTQKKKIPVFRVDEEDRET